MPLQQPVDEKWIVCFQDSFRLSGVQAGQLIVVLYESASQPILVKLAELGLARIGARVALVQIPAARLDREPAIRSTGTSEAANDYADLLVMLAGASLIVDLTVEGILHSPARQALLNAGGRVYMISNEHPEILERCRPTAELSARVAGSLRLLTQGKQMRVTSPAGTDLVADLTGASVRGGAGFLPPGEAVAYWPAGLAACFPKAGAVSGKLVLDVGDVNLTFKRYIESPVVLSFEKDRIVDIAGTGLDAVSLRSYFASWDDPDAYMVSHIGWGLNPYCRWDSLHLYDRNEVNGTEMRAIEGSFLLGTGASEFNNRFTKCHFDFPMRNCDLEIDGQKVLTAGRLVADFG